MPDYNLFPYNTVNFMMTSSNGSLFRVPGPLSGEVTGEFASQRASNADFDVFYVGSHWLLNKQSNDRSLESTLRSCDFMLMLSKLLR